MFYQTGYFKWIKLRWDIDGLWDFIVKFNIRGDENEFIIII